MTYVGAFVTHGDDPELYIVTGKVSAGARVRILKWGTNVSSAIELVKKPGMDKGAAAYSF